MKCVFCDIARSGATAFRVFEDDEVVAFLDAKPVFKDKIKDRLKWVDGQLAGCDYLMGERFCVADAYMFTVTNWTSPVGIDVGDLKNLAAYRARVAARPAVQEAMQAEGLAK